MFYRRIKHRYDIGMYELMHNCFNLHAPERVRIFYSVIKHWYKWLISILGWQYRLCLYNAMHKFFRKLILTGCCLVTWTVKVISTDLEHGPIYLQINNTQFVSFFLHRRIHVTVLEYQLKHWSSGHGHRLVSHLYILRYVFLCGY